LIFLPLGIIYFDPDALVLGALVLEAQVIISLTFQNYKG